MATYQKEPIIFGVLFPVIFLIRLLAINIGRVVIVGLPGFNVVSPLMVVLLGCLKLGVNCYTVEEIMEIQKELAV